MSPHSETQSVGTAKFLGWRMVAIAFFCTNVGLGFAFGTYGPFIAAIDKELPAPQWLLSAGLGLIMTMMGVLAPLVSYLIARWSLRAVFTIGALLMSCTFLLVSVVVQAWQFVAVIGILGGAAMTFLVLVPATTLVSQWFVEGRGKATGIVMSPLFVTVLPPVAALSIASFGWRATALVMGLLPLALLPAVRLIVDRPEDLGQRPLGMHADPEIPAGAPAGADTAADDGPHPARQPVFWIVTLCSGIITSAAVTMTTHLVPFAVSRGVALPAAALLLSVLAGVGILGGIVFGVVADRIGGARAYALVALLQVFAWPMLLWDGGYASLAALVAVIGICGCAISAVTTTLFANLFGRKAFAKVMGLFSLSTMPFSLFLPSLAGLIYDRTASYQAVFIFYAVLFGLAGSVLWLLHGTEMRRMSARFTTPARIEPTATATLAG